MTGFGDTELALVITPGPTPVLKLFVAGSVSVKRFLAWKEAEWEK